MNTARAKDRGQGRRRGSGEDVNGGGRPPLFHHFCGETIISEEKGTSNTI